MNKIIKYIIVAVVFFTISLPSVVAQSDTATIKQIIESYYPQGNLYVGSACHERYLNTETEEILNSEFGYVTPANEFKQSYIHSEPGKWQWEKSDIWINQCSEQNQIMRLHAPISPQCSKWVKDDSRTAEELDLILEEYMTALCTTYCNEPHVKWLDVVNETINKDGTWFGPKPGTDLWENPWPIIGFDDSHEINPPIYIKKAFVIANEYAPNTKLIINQHGAFEEVVWEKMKKLVSYLRENNLKVDGVGWQAHINLGWELEEGNLERLSNFVDWCHQNELEFHITEFNVWLREGDELKYDEQANTFYEIVKLLSAKQNTGIVGINFWHMRGIETANPTRDGCLWTDNYEPKPAYYKVKQALIESANYSSYNEGRIKTNDNIIFYPNPTKDEFSILFDEHISSVTLINQLGQQFQVKVIAKSVNIKNLSAGIYSVIVQSEHGLKIGRIIKL